MLLDRIRTEDHRAARAELRRQVARLERELAAYAPARTGGADVPRLLGLGALERTRDELLHALDDARAAEHAAAEREAVARARLHDLLEDPAAHPGARVTLAELGEPGCGAYSVRPRLGLLGRLRGWWVVKLSSGCPLSGRHAASRRRATPSIVRSP